MKDRTATEVLGDTPGVDAEDAIKYCLKQMIIDEEHSVDDLICKDLTYEEVLGALVSARSEIQSYKDQAES